jgi:hypothetical protein
VPQVYDIDEVDVMGGTYYQEDPRATLEENLAFVGGRKAVVIKEFGIVGDASFASVSLLLSQLVYYSGDPALGPGALVSGALLWSLRGHARGGGFYWHFETSSDGTYPASLHWPGFIEGGARDSPTLSALPSPVWFCQRTLPLTALPPLAAGAPAYEKELFTLLNATRLAMQARPILNLIAPCAPAGKAPCACARACARPSLARASIVDAVIEEAKSF